MVDLDWSRFTELQRNLHVFKGSIQPKFSRDVLYCPKGLLKGLKIGYLKVTYLLASVTGGKILLQIYPRIRSRNQNVLAFV